MRKILLSIGLSLTAMLAFAQQDPQFSQNMFLKLPINPGYAGTNGALCATAAYRTQWVGFPGAPKTVLFSLDAPVPALHGGAGLTIVSDKLGNFGFFHARGAYSYHKMLGQTGLLGIGLEVGILQSNVKFNWIAPDGTTGDLDDAIPDATVKKMTYDVGFGAYYRTEQLYVGISASHLPESSLKGKELNYQAARHYYVIAGYDFFLTSTLKLRPSAHVKSDAAITTFDLNCNLLWNDMIWGGLSYRLQDAIVPHVGVAWQPNQRSTLKIGYAYDLGLSDLKSHHKNTHEILVNYCVKFPPKVKTQSHINPRFLK